MGKTGGSTDNLSNTGGNRIEEVIDIVTDSQKNIYVLAPVGQTLLNIDGNPKTNYGDSSSKTDFTLSSFSCDGTYRWSKIIGGGGVEKVTNIQIDNQDNVYVAGRFTTCSSPYYARIDNDVVLNTYTSASCKTLFIAKYDTNGNLVWFKEPQALVTQAIATSQTGHRGFAIDASGALNWLISIPSGTYADGAFVNSMSGNNIFNFKYDANGNFISATHFDIQLTSSFILNFKFYRNPYNGYFYVSSSKDATATAVVGGQTVNGSGFIACFNELGQFQWKKEDTYTGASGLRFYDLAFDSSNNIFLSGQLLGQSNNTFLGLTVPESINPPFLMKVSPTADTIFWSTYPPISSGPYNYGAIALNGSEVAFTNSCAGTNYTWGSQVLNASNISNGEGIETLFARFNSSTGACLGLHKIPGNAGFDDQGTVLTVDVSGDYILGGGFGGQLTINGTTLSNAGTQTDFFIAKFATSVCSPLSNEEFNLNEIKVYPNPVKDNLYWQGETGWTSYEVYSVLGQKVAEGKVLSGQNQINISHLTKGIYVLQCSDASGNVKAFKIAKE